MFVTVSHDLVLYLQPRLEPTQEELFALLHFDGTGSSLANKYKLECKLVSATSTLVLYLQARRESTQEELFTLFHFDGKAYSLANKYKL